MKEIEMRDFFMGDENGKIDLVATAMLAKDYASSGGVYKNAERILASLLVHPNNMIRALALITLTRFGWDLEKGTRFAISISKSGIEESGDYPVVERLSDLLDKKTVLAW